MGHGSLVALDTGLRWKEFSLAWPLRKCKVSKDCCLFQPSRKMEPCCLQDTGILAAAQLSEQTEVELLHNSAHFKVLILKSAPSLTHAHSSWLCLQNARLPYTSSRPLNSNTVPIRVCPDYPNWCLALAWAQWLKKNLKGSEMVQSVTSCSPKNLTVPLNSS